MKIYTSIILKTILSFPVVKSFTPHRVMSLDHVSNIVLLSSSSSNKDSIRFRSTTSLSESNLPTIEQLSSDPFMKQVSHSSNIIPLLLESNNNEVIDKEKLKSMITAQLSHSDGIRGFFVSYLTGEGETTAADEENVPITLLEVMKSIETNELISLACMNVIMPVAMTSMHTDPVLSANSGKTAKRGIKILKAILDKPGTVEQCKAIYNVAKGNIVNVDNDKDIKYWIEFFDKWGYQDKQKKDIEDAMVDILNY